jgi:hypothetical protein
MGAGVQSWQDDCDGKAKPMSIPAWLALVLLVLVAVLLVIGLDRLRPCWAKPLRVTWPSALLMLAGMLVIVLTGQGREVAMGLAGAPVHQHVLFVLAVTYWAVQAWHWARFSLNELFGRDRAAWGERERAIRWLPRLYGILAFVTGAWALAMALRTAGLRPDLVWTALGLLAGFLFFLSFVLIRGHLADWLGAGRRVAVAFLVISLLVLAGVLLPTYWRPVETGEYLGSAVVAFLALGTWVSGLSAVKLLGKQVKLPLLMIIVAIMLAVGWLRSLNPVRTVPVASCPDPAAATRMGCLPERRPNLDAALQSWAAAQPPSGGGPMPMVLVATAGGGLRAAYWTGAVLGRLTDAQPSFPTRLFAISGVSGGSVGALAYAALVRAEQLGQPVTKRYAEKLDAALARDFLGPNLAGAFFVDPLRFLLPWLAPTGGRGTALESGFEAAWSRAAWAGAESPMDGPFLNLWPSAAGEPWVPGLLLNATHLETGRRVIASNIKIETAPFLDAWDLHDLLGADVYATVAAHNSARFSWISPAGELWARDGRFKGDVIDGGYFENYGALALRELAQGLLDAAARQNLSLRLIVIQISSDPGLAQRDRTIAPDCNGTPGFLPFDAAHDLRSVSHLADELLAPVGGVLSARSARGVLASKDLSSALACVGEDGTTRPLFVHFAMPDTQPYPPLGWVMTQSTRDQITKFLDAPENREAWTRVMTALPTP